MSNKKPSTGSAISNRRASFDYHLSDELMVGVVLTGLEARAAREGHVQLRGSYVSIDRDELWLHNASFSLRNNDKSSPDTFTVDQTPRKLLAKKKEIEKLKTSKEKGQTILPIKMLNKGRYIKLIIALGKGKKVHDKRETIKRRDQDRDTQRTLKRY